MDKATPTKALTEMTYERKLAALKELQTLVDKEKSTALKVLVYEFKSKVHASGFTLEEVLELLGAPKAKRGRKAAVTKAPRAKKAAGAKKSRKASQTKLTSQPKRGATYKNPVTGETWTKSPSGKGQTIKWLHDLVASGKTFEEFEVK